MAKGDSAGSMVCPCCGGAWVATESKTGGVSLICAKGFQGLAKYPSTVAGIRARLEGAAGPAPEAKPESKPAPVPAKGRTFADFMGAASK